MSKIKSLIFMSLVAILVAHAPVAAFTPAPPLGVNANGVNEGPGGVPHYFGPYGNWAFSPLPMGPIAVVTVVDGGTGYTAPTVTITDAYITPTTPATVTAAVDANGVITGFTIVSGGADYVAPVVTITDPTGTGALADAVIGAGTLGGPLTAGNPLIGRPYATDNSSNVFVVNNNPLPAGNLTAFQTFVMTTAGSSAQPSVGLTFNAYVLRPQPGGGYQIVFDSGLLTVPAVAADQAVTYPLGTSFAVQAGDLIAHFGQGIPIDIGIGSDTTLYPATQPIAGQTIDLITTPGPVLAQARTYSLGATVNVSTTTLSGGIRKFVDSLPGLGPAGANNLGQYIPVAVSDTTAYPGSHYYEIALVEYYEQMHSDLPGPLNPNTPGALGTKLRGYVQIEPPGSATIPAGSLHVLLPGITYNGAQVYGYDKPHYLGPLIVAQGRVHGIPDTAPGDPGKPVPVRIKFYNLLPIGISGDLFIPVDETVAGAGLGPALPGSAGDKYTQNRATIHLHGNNTVWISDGNVHQWITPANENTPYPKGVSVRNVPDMGTDCDAPGSGCQTFFYTNAQSARLQFYHDHAMAITRLNVYAGEAAGYVVTDAVEQDMINGTNVTGVNNLTATNSPLDPGQTNAKVLPGLGIPLVIQDKTWVDPNTIYAQDPTWNSGTNPGALWYPHVYMTVQNPWDLTGTNGFGRWHYGPWFNPPVPECVNGLPVGCIEVGPVPNEYFQPDCDLVPPGPGCTAPWEPPMRPGNPNPSIPGESFLDTAMVNGTAYPYLDIPAAPVRFRVLNAANDRMLNLQLYVAADKTAPTTADTNYVATPARLCDGSVAVENCTEVKMVPVSVAPANQYADTPSGIPDPTTKGPDWWLIGTEGGFMPKPVVVPQKPIGYNLDPAYFSFGLVNQKSLFLGSAERADVVVDFSAYAGKTLILYNDSPAPVPAGAAPYDFFTGNGNQMDGGGAPNTQPGYGPNIRTIMQIRVGAATNPTPDVTLANLNAVFAKTATKRGVFEVSQDPIIIPQAAYNSAYNSTFPATAVKQYIQIAETSKTFQPINEAGVLQPAVTLPLEMKAMHDEMGGVYDTLFGRMSGMLGLSNPLSPVHVLIPYGLAAPPTDIVKGSVEGTPIGVMPDGTQIWRIFHNGVDTHTIHTHLFHTQLINRVGQDGQVTGGTLAVDPIELGWKDTFRVNPLEVTYLAMRPTVPVPAHLPFEVPDSVRLIDPTLPEGATLIPPPPAGWFDPDGVQIPEILNHYVNFGWEYVWHCHILSHEEMDMMHSLVFAVPPKPPTLNTTYTVTGPANNPTVNLTWIDNSIKEAGFTVQRASDANFSTGLTAFNVGPNIVTFSDTTVASDTAYWYRVFAIGNPVGDTQAYPGSLGFPTMSADSVSNTLAVTVGVPTTGVPADPTLLTTLVQSGPRVRLRWMDNATTPNPETGFAVERCTVVAPATTCSNFAQIALAGPNPGTGFETYFDATVTAGNTYFYQVWAVNANGRSVNPTNQASATVPAIPLAPTNFRVSVVKNPNGPNYTATLTWDAVTNPTNFRIQRATNATFTRNLNTVNPGGAVRTITQTLNPNTTYYFRIRANDNISGPSAWTNALPFPIRTGP